MRIKKLTAELLGIVLLLVIWQLISIQIHLDALFPSLPVLVKTVFVMFTKTEFYISIFDTILRGLIGVILSFILAFILASVSAFSGFWKSFFHPFVVVIRSVPVISLVLLALLWLMPENLPVFIALMTMFPILYQNILSGLELTDIRLVEMTKVFGKSNLFIFTHIYLPSAKNVIYSGLSSAMGFGWRAIIIGEALAQPVHGIGTGMKKAQSYINVSELIAWTIIAIIISYLFDFLIKKTEKINFHFHLKDTHKPISLKSKKEITFRNLIKTYQSDQIINIEKLQLSDNKIYALHSPSGSGKTTLFRLISGLDNDYDGEIIKNPYMRIAYVFQDIRLIPWLNIKENISFGHQLNNTQLQKFDTLITAMELNEHISKFPHQLSGGQQQRVGLARALFYDCDVLLLDEPMSGLDISLKNRLKVFLKDWFIQNNLLVLWATHEQISDITEIQEILLK